MQKVVVIWVIAIFGQYVRAELPWLLISQEVRSGKKFISIPIDEKIKDKEQRVCVGGPLSNRYCVIGDQANWVINPDSIKMTNPAAQVVFSKYAEDKWFDLSSAEEFSQGFYRARFLSAGKERYEQTIDFIVCKEWKKELLAFYRKIKEQIESNTGVNSICVSVGVSQVDYAMEKVAGAYFPTGEIINDMVKVVEAGEAVKKGQVPELVEQGMNRVLIRRYPGASVAEFAVHLPENYKQLRKVPIYIHADPLRWGVGKYGQVINTGLYNFHPGMVDIWWHTVQFNRLEWKDYEYLIEVLAKRVDLDMDRVYLHGPCGNGIAAMSLALHHPDAWAEVLIDMGNSFCNLSGNALNLRMDYIRGVHAGENAFDAWYEFTAKCFEYFKCPYVRTDVEQVSNANSLGARNPVAIRERGPKRVLLTIDSLKNGRAYWVQVLGRADENLHGSIDVRNEGETIEIRTQNVNAYRLYLENVLGGKGLPIRVVENGLPVGHVGSDVFEKLPQEYRQAKWVKSERLCGPVSDVFDDSYVVVYGLGGPNPDFSRAGRELAETIARGAPCYPEDGIPASIWKDHHLVLVGEITSPILRDMIKDFPVQLRKGYVEANGKRYSGDVGYALIYPNPQNPEKYVSVFSGTSVKAMGLLPRSVEQVQELTTDVYIYRVNEKMEAEKVIRENFDTTWTWHAAWDRILMSPKQKHNAQKWQQWITKIVRKELGSDVAICPDPLVNRGGFGTGPITIRELFGAIDNFWMIKIRMTGKALKKVLLECLTDASGFNIDGVSCGGMDKSALKMSQIRDEKLYTAVVRHKFLSRGQGRTIQEYTIVDQGYLFTLLVDYLINNKNVNVDQELDSIKMNLF